MGYSIDPITEDCYEGTTCLINKFDIRDSDILSKVEADITFAKSSELERNPINGKFDFDHYKAIHKYLFSDIYEWAGKTRNVNISKKGTRFVDYDRIDSIANACFKRLADNEYFSKNNRTDFIKNIADFYCVTNMLHPFREGNGRTQRLFISQLIRYNGYQINFSDIDADDLMLATIHAANGVSDYLLCLFDKHITASH